MAMKERRLANKAEWDRRMIQQGLTPSNDELPPRFCPDPERLKVLKERRRARLEQERLEKEHEEKELEAMEHEMQEYEARERETQATREATTSGGMDPQALVAECPPLGHSQVSACNADGPTELEIALATPDLSPEIKKFLGQKKFQNAAKMVPSDILTTARRVYYFH